MFGASKKRLITPALPDAFKEKMNIKMVKGCVHAHALRKRPSSSHNLATFNVKCDVTQCRNIFVLLQGIRSLG